MATKATKAKKAEPPSADLEVVRIWDRISELNESAFSLREEWEELSEAAKEKKKAWENTVREVQRLIREAKREYPLFAGTVPEPAPAPPADDVIDVQCEPATDSTGNLARAIEDATAPAVEAPSGPEPSPDPPADDDWRSVPIEVLVEKHGLTRKLAKVLEESNITTIGAISDLQVKGLDLTDVKGVGEAARDKIVAALDLFWQSRAAAE